MNAIIFAAGLGTRLQPLTNSTPKALVLLNNKPLLWHAITYLEGFGINKIIVNIHHFGDQIIEYINQNKFNAEISISDERDCLLDTGGGLLKAKSLLLTNEPIIAINVDIITSANLGEIINFHLAQNALATLVVRKRETSRYFMFDEMMQLAGWKNFSTGDEIKATQNFNTSSPWAFSGIQILSPEIFNFITQTGKFSVTPMYLKLAENHKIVGYADTSNFWLDLGKHGQIEIAEKYLKAKEK